MGKKVVYRIFTIADYDREASYFKKMHGQGWKLKKVNYFEKMVIIISPRNTILHAII